MVARTEAKDRPVQQVLSLEWARQQVSTRKTSYYCLLLLEAAGHARYEVQDLLQD